MGRSPSVFYIWTISWQIAFWYHFRKRTVRLRYTANPPNAPSWRRYTLGISLRSLRPTITRLPSFPWGFNSYSCRPTLCWFGQEEWKDCHARTKRIARERGTGFNGCSSYRSNQSCYWMERSIRQPRIHQERQWLDQGWKWCFTGIPVWSHFIRMSLPSPHLNDDADE